MNVFRTGVLLSALVALFGVAGYALGGQGGLVISLGVAVLMNVFAYWHANSFVLRMHGAPEIGRDDMPGFHDMVGQLAERPGLGPKIVVMAKGCKKHLYTVDTA